MADWTVGEVVVWAGTNTNELGGGRPDIAEILGRNAISGVYLHELTDSLLDQLCITRAEDQKHVFQVSCGCYNLPAAKLLFGSMGP